MLSSMTGFGAKETKIASFGRVRVELRSTNHKFLETVFHLPELLLSLEDKIKKEVESKVKRGRVTCAINILGGSSARPFINKALLKDYCTALKGIQKQLCLKEAASLNTLIHLPGVLSLEEGALSKNNLWPKLKVVVASALEDLVRTRQKEGRGLAVYLKKRTQILEQHLTAIRARFKKALTMKLTTLKTDEERAAFLKDTDISEEIQRLAFHISNFRNRLSKTGPIGKEMDFIAQEMQREANTLSAKSFDTGVSGRAVEMKSQIEKIREQVQNIE